jgi:Cu+-exporting ATPase
MQPSTGFARDGVCASFTLMMKIRQNPLFAFIYSSLGVSVAAGTPHPFLGRLLSPTIAAAPMSLSSVPVISHALGPRRLEP